MALYTVIVQNSVTPDRIGQVTSGLTLFRQLGATIGLSVMGSFVTSRFGSDIAADIPASVRRAVPTRILDQLDKPQIVVSPQAQAGLQRYFAHFGARGPALFDQLRAAIKLALAQAIHDVFIASVGITALALVIVFFLKEVPLRGRVTAPVPRQEADAPQPERGAAFNPGAD